MVYPNLKILLSNRNEWTTDTFNKVDESQNNYFERKKSAICKRKKKKTKLFILDESIQKWKLSYGGRKQISGHGLGWGQGQQRREGGDEETFKGEKYVHNLFYMTLSCVCVCVCVKTYRILKFEFTQYIYVNYSLIKLLNFYLNNKYKMKGMTVKAVI